LFSPESGEVLFPRRFIFLVCKLTLFENLGWCVFQGFVCYSFVAAAIFFFPVLATALVRSKARHEPTQSFCLVWLADFFS